MNLEELRDVCRTERQRDGLQHLRESFYRDVADYLADLKAERERTAERADDPFSDPEVRRLSDEIGSAEDLAESLYERRVGKVVKLASFAAAGMSHDDEGLTDEERDLFDDLVARIEANRERVLGSLDPDAAPAPADAGDPEPTPVTDAGDPEPAPVTDAGDSPDPNDLLSEAMGGTVDDAGRAGDDTTTADASESDTGGAPTADGGAVASPAEATEPSPGDDAPPTDESPAAPTPTPGGGSTSASDPAGESTSASDPADPGGDASDADRTMVYVTREVGEIYGVDERTYRLDAEDVVELPADNAQVLVEQGVAEPLE